MQVEYEQFCAVYIVGEVVRDGSTFIERIGGVLEQLDFLTGEASQPCRAIGGSVEFVRHFSHLQLHVIHLGTEILNFSIFFLQRFYQYWRNQVVVYAQVVIFVSLTLYSRWNNFLQFLRDESVVFAFVEITVGELLGTELVGIPIDLVQGLHGIGDGLNFALKTLI